MSQQRRHVAAHSQRTGEVRTLGVKRSCSQPLSSLAVLGDDDIGLVGCCSVDDLKLFVPNDHVEVGDQSIAIHDPLLDDQIHTGKLGSGPQGVSRLACMGREVDLLHPTSVPAPGAFQKTARLTN